MDSTALIAGGVAIVVALLGLFGVLLGQLYSRVSHLEARVGEAEDFVTRLREWAISHLQLYLTWRKDGAPDPHPLPGRED